MRAFLGWLRGEADHCSMAAIPTLAEEDGKRPTRERESRVYARNPPRQSDEGRAGAAGHPRLQSETAQGGRKVQELRTGAGEPLPPNTLAELRRDMAQLRFVADQIKQIEKAREARLEKAPREGAHPMVLMLASIKGVGLETAEMLVAEVLSRKLRDRRAVARYGGLTGSPDESGSRSREKGLARSGNARVRRGMIQLAWRFLMFQRESAPRAVHWWCAPRTIWPARFPSGTSKTARPVGSSRRAARAHCPTAPIPSRDFASRSRRASRSGRRNGRRRAGRAACAKALPPPASPPSRG